MSPLRVLAAGLCSLPWLRSCPAMPPVLRDAVDLSFRGLCHHLPARVLELNGEPMCVCSRCAGLFAGLALGLLLPALSLRAADWRSAFYGACAVTLVDVVTQDLGMHAPSHPVRLATGACLGLVTATWLVASTERTPSALAPLPPR